MRRAELAVESGSEPERRCALQPVQPLALGRGEDVDVPILDSDASPPRHLQVELSAAGVALADLGSRNEGRGRGPRS